MNEKKAKLLYITSMGHSGSTLLDLLCGSVPGIFSMGEVQFLSWQLLQGGKPEDPQTYCSCGKSFEQCEVWGEIIKDLSDSSGIDIFKNPRQYNFSLNRFIIRHKIKIYYYVMNRLLNLALSFRFLYPLSYLIYLIFKPSVKRNWMLFDKTVQKTDSKYVVDSSKEFLRFWLLRMFRPEDTKLIILKRDIKGVVSSSHNGLNSILIKKRAKQWIKFYNRVLKPVRRIMRSEDWMFINYEDFCRDPNKIRNDIARFTGTQLPEKPIDYISPYKYHTIQGNPMRLKKEDLKIRYDERWKERLTDTEKRWLDRISRKKSKIYKHF